MNYVFWFDFDNGFEVESVETIQSFVVGTDIGYIELSYDDWMMSYGFNEDEIETMISSGNSGFYEE